MRWHGAGRAGLESAAGRISPRTCGPTHVRTRRQKERRGGRASQGAQKGKRERGAMAYGNGMKRFSTDEVADEVPDGINQPRFLPRLARKRPVHARKEAVACLGAFFPLVVVWSCLFPQSANWWRAVATAFSCVTHTREPSQCFTAGQGSLRTTRNTPTTTSTSEAGLLSRAELEHGCMQVYPTIRQRTTTRRISATRRPSQPVCLSCRAAYMYVRRNT